MTILGGATLVAPGGVLDPGWLEITGEHIGQIGYGPPPGPPDHDLSGRWLLPGFVDIHVHGGGGSAFAEGAHAARTAAAFHLGHGTTTLLASLVSAPVEELSRTVGELAELVGEGPLAGIHLEGPFLSAARCGAHDPEALADPDADSVRRLLDAGAGAVRMVTLAPELPGGMEAVRRIADSGALAAIGHTDATFDQVRQAVDAGARVATHVFNGMPPLHHRDPGPVGALLADPRVSVEVINDGVHLHPATLRLVAAAASGRTVLVTDAMAAAGMGDGRYRLGPLDVEVHEGAARLAGSDALAGSTLTMADAFGGAARDLGVEAAVEMASAAPARLLQRHDIGALAPGNRADMVVADRDFRVQGVLCGGAWAPGTQPA